MERILDGEEGLVKELALKTLIAVGEAYGAEKMIEISSAHISGVSFDTIGEHGKDLLRKFSEAKVSVRTTLNPIGFDRDFPSMVDESFYREQIEILDIFERMGVKSTCSCTPYYYENVPSFGEIIAWAESSAIVYANSVLGARCNRESGLSALCSAILGISPYHSLHIKENRSPTIKIRVSGRIHPGKLGLYLGRELSGIPYMIFERIVDIDYLKQLGAAMAASGNISLFHAEGLTPEFRDFSLDGLPQLTLEERDVEDESEDLSEFDAVVLGCPHLSEEEIKSIYLMLREKRLLKDVYLFTSRTVLSRASRYISCLRNIGVKIFSDTCMVVSPYLRRRYRILATNSGKAYNYLRSKKFGGFRVILASLEEILDASSR